MIPDKDLQLQIDELRANVIALRAQITQGVGVPEYRGSSAGDALIIASGFPAWSALPFALTGISATSPLSITGTPSSPNVSMPVATSIASGYLSSTNWSTFNNKVSSVGATSPVASSGGTSPTISMPVATTSVNGYLSSTNWTTFNNKVGSVGASGVLTATGTTVVAITHNASGASAGTYTNATVTVNATGHVTYAVSGATPAFIAFDNTFTENNLFGSWYSIRKRFTKAITPSTSNWYRVGTFTASNYGQYAEIYLMCIFSGTHNYIKLRVSKTTYNTTGTDFVLEVLGDYDINHGFAEFRVIDGGTNGPSYVDVKFSSTAAVTVAGSMINASPFGTNSIDFAFDTNLTSQGTGASGTAFGAKNTFVKGNTNVGIVDYRQYSGNTISLKSFTAAGITDSSDKKFKSDIRKMHDGLFILRGLKPVRFFNELTQQNEIGFVAQDLQSILPEVVQEAENGDLSVAYQRIVAPIVQAIQSIDSRLMQLEQK